MERTGMLKQRLSRGGASMLMASDGSPGGSLQAGNNFSVSVDCDSIEEIERLFAALGDKGQIRLPLGDMPLGARFGMLTDQFGIQWLFSCALVWIGGLVVGTLDILFAIAF